MGPIERIAITQCIGCGAMHEDAACDGPCTERRLELTSAGSFDAAAAALDAAESRTGVLLAAVSECAEAEAEPGEERSALRRSSRAAHAALQRVHELDSPVPPSPEERASDPVVVWRCVDCGAVDEPQECIDVCVRRRFVWVEAAAFRQLSAQLEAALATERSLVAVLDRIAYVKPRSGAWERNWRALSSQARAVLAEARSPAAPPLRV